jgi:hypothetical protein
MYRTLGYRRLLPWTTDYQRRAQLFIPAFNPAQTFHLTQPPNPNWDIGQGIPKTSALAAEWNEGENQGWKTWALEGLSGKFSALLIPV